MTMLCVRLSGTDYCFVICVVVMIRVCISMFLNYYKYYKS